MARQRRRQSPRWGRRGRQAEQAGGAGRRVLLRLPHSAASSELCSCGRETNTTCLAQPHPPLRWAHCCRRYALHMPGRAGTTWQRWQGCTASGGAGRLSTLKLVTVPQPAHAQRSSPRHNPPGSPSLAFPVLSAPPPFVDISQCACLPGSAASDSCKATWRKEGFTSVRLNCSQVLAVMRARGGGARQAEAQTQSPPPRTHTTSASCWVGGGSL